MDIIVYYEPWLRAYRAYDQDEEEPLYVGIGRTQQEAVADLIEMYSYEVQCNSECTYDWNAQ
jgi:hypothetical protein